LASATPWLLQFAYMHLRANVCAQQRRFFCAIVCRELDALELSNIIRIVPISPAVTTLLCVFCSQRLATVWTGTGLNFAGRTRLTSMCYPCFALAKRPAGRCMKLDGSHSSTIVETNQLSDSGFYFGRQLGQLLNQRPTFWALCVAHGMSNNSCINSVHP
jgi:hypothetical protein